GLLNFQVGQAFYFQNATREDIGLAFLLNGQQALLDGVQRNGVNQIAQGDAGLHFAFKAHQYRLRHIQGHNTGSSGKGHQTGTGGEGDADGEAGVGVAAGAHGVGQQHAVQPAVDDAVTGTQGNAATGHNEVGQGVLGVDIHRFGVSGGVTEGLHGQVGREAETGQVFQF